LANPNDVVVHGLNPSEDYKTCLLSGFSPMAITEVAGRGLAFCSYQASQEISLQRNDVVFVIESRVGSARLDRFDRDIGQEELRPRRGDV
jgi:hypothetical protein